MLSPQILTTPHHPPSLPNLRLPAHSPLPLGGFHPTCSASVLLSPCCYPPAQTALPAHRLSNPSLAQHSPPKTSVFTIKQPKTLKLCFELVCPLQPHGSCRNCFLSAAFEADCKSRHAHIYVSSNFLQVKNAKQTLSEYLSIRNF